MSAIALSLRLARPRVPAPHAIRPRRAPTRPLHHTPIRARELPGTPTDDTPHEPTASTPPTRPPSTRPAPIRSPKQLPARRVIPDAELDERFLKGSGPGGQKINKTSSAVQLRHVPSGLVVKCQATRSRAQNRAEARRLLAERLDAAEHGAASRAGLKQAAKARKKGSAAKKARRKYRRLEEAKDRERASEQPPPGGDDAAGAPG